MAPDQQLWVARSGEALGSDLFQPVRSDPTHPRAKPDGGGLWTSTWDEQHGSGWVQWCIAEEFDCKPDDPTWEDCWLVTPADDANVYTIDSYDDLRRLCQLYGRTHTFGEDSAHGPFHDTFPDWSLVAEFYDAVRLTDEGQWKTRLTHPLNLYGWDCESTLWFRWAFTAAERIGTRTFSERDWDEVAA